MDPDGNRLQNSCSSRLWGHSMHQLLHVCILQVMPRVDYLLWLAVYTLLMYSVQ